MHYSQHPLSTSSTAGPFLNQTKIWVDRTNTVVKIKEMDRDYLQATMQWLLKRAEDLKFVMELEYLGGVGPSGDAASDAFNSEFTQFMELDSRKWIRGTPLFQKMMKRYKKSVAFDRPQIKLPLVEVVADSGSSY